MRTCSLWTHDDDNIIIICCVFQLTRSELKRFLDTNFWSVALIKSFTIMILWLKLWSSQFTFAFNTRFTQHFSVLKHVSLFYYIMILLVIVIIQFSIFQNLFYISCNRGVLYTPRFWYDIFSFILKNDNHVFIFHMFFMFITC